MNLLLHVTVASSAFGQLKCLDKRQRRLGIWGQRFLLNALMMAKYNVARPFKNADFIIKISHNQKIKSKRNHVFVHFTTD